ncbi:MAG: CbrC family protein, partial [Clostridia bacterium]|nr:CbrC family protein [Clostridia bacterium]
VEEHLYKDGDLCGYLFRCLHCGKYRLYVDAS